MKPLRSYLLALACLITGASVTWFYTQANNVLAGLGHLDCTSDCMKEVLDTDKAYHYDNLAAYIIGGTLTILAVSYFSWKGLHPQAPFPLFRPARSRGRIVVSLLAAIIAAAAVWFDRLSSALGASQSVGRETLPVVALVAVAIFLLVYRFTAKKRRSS